MADLDLTELRRQIDAASPKNGPGRVVKLERGYAKAIIAEIEQAAAHGMRVHTSLLDPVTVYVNMMHGQIAKPSVRQIIHIYGREALLAELEPSDA